VRGLIAEICRVKSVDVPESSTPMIGRQLPIKPHRVIPPSGRLFLAFAEVIDQPVFNLFSANCLRAAQLTHRFCTAPLQVCTASPQHLHNILTGFRQGFPHLIHNPIRTAIECGGILHNLTSHLSLMRLRRLRIGG
jgi:hypothetical protein